MKKGFKFGLELECAIPGDYSTEIDLKLTKLGVECSSDPTIRGIPARYIPKEYRTKPLPYSKMSRHVGQVCDVLNSYEAHVNRSCGLHLHTSNIRFDKQKYLKRIIHVWVAIEDVMIATQPPSRNGSDSYNKRVLRNYVYDIELQSLPRQKDRLVDKISNTVRRSNLNIKSLLKHKTIENRLHTGTTNKAKIRAWLELNRNFYIYCLTKYDPDKVNTLFKTKISDDKIKKVFKLLEVSDETVGFYNTRIKKHLFATLASEQESAFRTLELIPEKERILKQYNKARERLDNIERQVNDVAQPLGF